MVFELSFISPGSIRMAGETVHEYHTKRALVSLWVITHPQCSHIISIGFLPQEAKKIDLLDSRMLWIDDHGDAS
jgi:hypothetical protein